MPEPNQLTRFEQVVLPHLDAAYNLARWLTRNGHDAEDVVQEAYLRAFKFFSGFHGGDGRAWLLTIVRNTCTRGSSRTAPELTMILTRCRRLRAMTRALKRFFSRTSIMRCSGRLSKRSRWSIERWSSCVNWKDSLTKRLPIWLTCRSVLSCHVWLAPGSGCNNSCLSARRSS